MTQLTPIYPCVPGTCSQRFGWENWDGYEGTRTESSGDWDHLVWTFGHPDLGSGVRDVWVASAAAAPLPVLMLKPWVTAHDLAGHWTNVLANPGNDIILDIAAIDAQHLSVHPWGACTPTPCDQGSHQVLFSTNPLIYAYSQSGIGLRVFTVSLLADGRLQVRIKWIANDRVRSDTTIEWLERAAS